MKSATSRNLILVTIFAVGTQGMLLSSQFVFASFFGASATSDAFFAALALPLYVSTVLVSSIALVFLPILTEHRVRGGLAQGELLTNGVVNTTVLALVAIAVVGMLLADPLVTLTAPGLPETGHNVARALALVLWPSIVGAGSIVLLTAIWHVDSHFAWPAAVTLVGAAANLLLLAVLAPVIGTTGAAIGWTASSMIQALLLVPGLRRSWRPVLGLRHRGVRAVFLALAPLVLANVFIRASTVVERYLASELPTGELSHVTYASRVSVALAVLLSAAPMAVIFPRMAQDVASGGAASLSTTVASSLRSLWIVVAPVVALLIALADPGVRLVFEHGAFSRSDSESVSSLLRVYAPSLIAAALAAITGRAIYALKATRVLALIGAIEGLAYIAYTTLLTRALGAVGLALGFSIYYLGSLAWQLIYLRHALHAPAGAFARSFVQTSVAAGLAGVAAHFASGMAQESFVAVIWGGLVGVAAYAAALGLFALQRPAR